MNGGSAFAKDSFEADAVFVAPPAPFSRSFRGTEPAKSVPRPLGSGLGVAISSVARLLDAASPVPEREAVLSAFNGVLGDYLSDTGNPLAIPMQLRHRFEPLRLDRVSLLGAIPQPKTGVMVLVHGLCLSDRSWLHNGQVPASELADHLGCTPLTLQYNSGCHISTNGQQFASLLQSLSEMWPVPLSRIVLVGHSMGGLVMRSAVHAAEVAGLSWRSKLAALAFLATPHHGYPLERGGHQTDQILQWFPYAVPFSKLGRIRSAGITDFRCGNLLDAHWSDVQRSSGRRDPRQPVRLPTGVSSCAVAATLANAHAPIAQRLLGDGLVPLDSALGEHGERRFRLRVPVERRSVVFSTGHIEVLSRPKVYEQLAAWISTDLRRQELVD